MADRWNTIQQVLERESEEAMRDQVGTIFCSANDLNNLHFLHVLIKTGIITHQKEI